MRPNMRANASLLSLSLVVASAIAHDHNHQHVAHRHPHGGHRHVFARSASLKGQTVTVTDNTRTDSTSIPEIVVFVDDKGNPVSTALAVVELAPSTNLPVAEGLEQDLSPPVATEHVQATKRDSLAARRLKNSSVKQQQQQSSVGTPASYATSSGLFSVAYAPYNADGSCKTADQIMTDFKSLKGKYGMVRTYGVDCNQIPGIYAAAKANNLKTMYGIFSLDGLGDQIATLTKGINGDWSNVDTVSIGNELVNNGQASPKQITDALSSARKLLSAAGWTGPVVTVDTFVAALAHPELCTASDYCAVNIHPFFDPNTPAAQAGVFVANQVQNLRKKLGNPSARVRVTESGWPWQGASNGQAVPGVDQQTAAFNSIRSAFADNPSEMVLFSAFNDRWKTAAEATFYAEQYWGIGTSDAPSA